MKKQFTPLTPALNTIQVKKITQRINSQTPFYVKTAPLDLEIYQECFAMVERFKETNGGKSVLGWALWELPDFFIEAEFHCVWQSETGEYLDVSPRKHPTQNILFLPDDKIIYTGKPINSIRLPLTNNSVLMKWFELLDEIYNFRINNEIPGQLDIEYSNEQTAEFEKIMDKLLEVEKKIMNLYKPLGSYDPCFCGSGKKLKWCHKEVS